MTVRDVRELVVDAWSRRLRQLGVAQADYLALELAVIAEGHGVRLVQPARLHDPVAEDWRPGQRPTDVTPARESEHVAALRRQLAGDEQHEPDDEQPDPGQLALF